MMVCKIPKSSSILPNRIFGRERGESQPGQHGWLIDRVTVGRQDPSATQWYVLWLLPPLTSAVERSAPHFRELVRDSWFRWKLARGDRHHFAQVQAQHIG